MKKLDFLSALRQDVFQSMRLRVTRKGKKLCGIRLVGGLSDFPKKDVTKEKLAEFSLVGPLNAISTF